MHGLINNIYFILILYFMLSLINYIILIYVMFYCIISLT